MFRGRGSERNRLGPGQCNASRNENCQDLRRIRASRPGVEPIFQKMNSRASG
jgi:hypothetical protein